MIWLGLASNYSARDILRHSFAVGTNRDYLALESALSDRYSVPLAQTTLIYSGRSALALALLSFKEAGLLKSGDRVGVNAFTCHAVIQAVRAADLEPYYLDLTTNDTPNFSLPLLESALKSDPRLRAVIAQNTFGLPLNDRELLALKRKYNFLLLEDLAHCAGRFYPSGKEIGTIGDATCLSFGKGKSIDTITGGACLIRTPNVPFPSTFDKSRLKKRAKNGDTPRASWYPVFAATARGLSYLHLEKPFLALLLKLKWIERSADTALDLSRTTTNWQAKLALSQLRRLPTAPKNPAKSLLRDYYLVADRDACLDDLRKHGFRLEEFWYSTPVAPERYYKSLNFPETTCKNAVFFSEHVVNLPTWYNKGNKKQQVAAARKIIKKYRI